MSTLTIKRHDTARKLIDTLLVDGVALNLTGSTVYLVFRSASVLIWRRTATITGALTGSLEYQLTAVDVAQVMDFDLEWEVNFSDGTQLTFPASGYHRLKIEADLA